MEARDVLDRMGIQSVQQLLAVDRVRLRYLRGVGDKIRKEIRERAKRIAQLRPDLVPGGGSGEAAAWASIDRLVEQLLPRRPAGDERSEDRLLAAYLGLEPAEEESMSHWPTAGDVARSSGVPRSKLAEVVDQARQRWHKNRDLNALRTELDALLKASGYVATVEEMAGQLLAARGSVQEDPGDRRRQSHAVLRAALELEALIEEPRFAVFAEAAPVLIAKGPEHADYARKLGAVADRLCVEDPLPAPRRVEEQLDAIEPRPEDPPTMDRCWRLAVAASGQAALSARKELYPKAMAATAALRLALGSLAGPEELTEEELRKRVHGRFPDAEPLPPRPELDRLLDAVGAGRVWSEDHPKGPRYVSRSVVASDSGGWSDLPRHATSEAAPQATEEVLDARDLEEKIAHAAGSGAFLALTVEPRWARKAETELLRRFQPREAISLEVLLLRAMRDEAEARKVKWPVVLRADAEARDGKGFRNLLRLARAAAGRVQQDLLALDRPVLLTNPGLLARYDLMPLLSALAEASGTKKGPPSLWLLVPQYDGGLPQIDRVTPAGDRHG